MYHYGLLIEKIDKATGTTTLLKQHCKEKAFYTASTIKTVFLGMFLEHCSELLYQEVELSEKDKFIGGICYELKGKTRMTYEMLLWLMICISDNSATNIIFDTLTKKLGDLTTFLQKTFATQKTEVFDLKQQNGASYIKGSGQSTAQEFMKMFHYYVLESPHKDTIKKLLSYQYIKGRGLRYIDDKRFILSGNKTGQLDDMINDCGFLETKDELYLYVMFMKVPKHLPYQYEVENEYYKVIGNLIKKAVL